MPRKLRRASLYGNPFGVLGCFSFSFYSCCFYYRLLHHFSCHISYEQTELNLGWISYYFQSNFKKCPKGFSAFLSKTP